MSDLLVPVKAIYDGFFRGDIPSVLSHLHPEIRWRLVGDPAEIPFAGEFCGLAEVGAFFQRVGANCGVKVYDLREFHVGDNGDGTGHVAVFGYQIVTALPTGKDWETEFVHFHFVERGKVVRLHEVYHTAPMVRAFAGGAG